MKKLMISLAALAAVGAAVPAAAQTWGYSQHASYDRYDGYGRYNQGPSYGGMQINDRQARLADRIRRMEYRGQISHWQSVRIREDLGQVALLENRFRRHGLGPREVAELNARLDQVEARIAGISRAPRYGYNDGRYGRGW